MTPSSFQKEVKPAGTGVSQILYVCAGMRFPLPKSSTPSWSPKVDLEIPALGKPGPVRTNKMSLRRIDDPVRRLLERDRAALRVREGAGDASRRGRCRCSGPGCRRCSSRSYPSPAGCLADRVEPAASGPLRARLAVAQREAGRAVAGREGEALRSSELGSVSFATTSVPARNDLRRRGGDVVGRVGIAELARDDGQCT